MWKACSIKRNGKVCDLLGKKAKKYKGVLEMCKNIQYHFSEYKAGIYFAIIQDVIYENCKARNLKLVKVINLYCTA